MIKKRNEMIKQGVRWQDGSFDVQRRCSCGRVGCKDPFYTDHYKEVPTEGSRIKDYASWAECMNAAENEGFREPLEANPDQLPERAGELLAELQSNVSAPTFVEKAAAGAFEQLTAKQKEVWVLHMQQGLPIREIVDRLDININAVNDRLKGAKAKYSNYLRRYQDEERGA